MQRRGLALAGQSVGRMAAKRPSSDMAAFREHLAKARSVLVLTGAGVSAESGVPTFRGAGGLWRKYEATSLASPVAFAREPSLVWEFCHYRRELVLTKAPNAGHKAIAEAQARFLAEGKEFAVVTQNVDGLHSAAGATDLLELHGSLFKVRCTKCQEVTENRTSPICEALRGRGAPEKDANGDPIPTDQLPKCSKCGGLLRPHIVWFGEQLEAKVLEAAHSAMESCDVCLVVGTLSVVYPAAMFAPSVAQRGVPVAEFNLEVTPRTEAFGFHFQGPSAETLPIALAPFSST